MTSHFLFWHPHLLTINDCATQLPLDRLSQAKSYICLKTDYRSGMDSIYLLVQVLLQSNLNT